MGYCLIGFWGVLTQGHDEQLQSSPAAPAPEMWALIIPCPHPQSRENWDSFSETLFPKRTCSGAKDTSSTVEEVCPGPSPAPDATSGRLSAQSCSSFLCYCLDLTALPIAWLWELLPRWQPGSMQGRDCIWGGALFRRSTEFCVCVCVCCGGKADWDGGPV